MKHSFLIAAPSSNSGKTIVTLGLIMALRNLNFNIQPFKCGPDYIDPLHHSQVAGVQSYNLDVWMSDEAHINAVYGEQMQKADIGIVEGVMGLFDGAKKDTGSSAEIARILDLPVVLVVNAAATAYSVAPLLYGFKNFNKNIRVEGVIFNKVSGDSHYQFLKEAAEDAGVVALGYIPKNDKLTLESRHLGLSLTENDQMLLAVDEAAKLIEQHVNLEHLLQITQREIVSFSNEERPVRKKEIRIAIAQDEAFNFMYPANVDRLKEIGDIMYFSPLYDNDITECELLWFPGGYPELFAPQLAANTDMLNAIRRFEKLGGRIVAECGGMMYMGKSVELKDGSVHPMLGLIDYETSIRNMKLKLGYRSVEIDRQLFKGHEFHYSTVSNDCAEKADAWVQTARGATADMAIYRTNNIWASYFHIYLGEKDKMENFIQMMLRGGSPM
ncbi:cobyrinate a,c-diamide synthase [Carboxylicivirga sediminis]|uniref:Cobyrinate a,c-diamide synthase n=1 Tax=Carboxylicivirga sediminis TaxID=2006564 RepID=A0A941IYA6_9BACT|nr:cobyrinate a,c-diamide synthase [Carboxylicivirga sediminis]MBR8536820.1 cobyrinate a,c-diamide synthase [Carboxylicivirga sediminis]